MQTTHALERAALEGSASHQRADLEAQIAALRSELSDALTKVTQCLRDTESAERRVEEVRR